jgi:hypothetical protein
MTDSVKTKNRLILLAILAVFVVPFALAWLFAVGPLEWRPQSTLNYGVLLQPPLQLETYDVMDATRSELTLDAVARDWYLVVLHTAACSDTCREIAQSAINIQLAVGRDSHRVKVALLSPEEVAPAPLAENWFLPTDSGFLQDLSRAAGEQLLENLLLIVDFQGYVVLLYPTIDDVYGPLGDLELLLDAAPS